MLLAVVFAVAACTRSAPEAAVSPAITHPDIEPTAAASAEPTSEPTTAETFAPSAEPAPPLHLVGDDYEQMVRSYYAFRTWLYRRPDPDLVDRIYHPDCSCYQSGRELLTYYQEEGLWWARPEGAIQVREVQVVDNRSPALVHVLVVVEQPGVDELIDSTGTVHERLEPEGPRATDLIFVRADPASPWLLRDFIDRGPIQ